MTESESVALPLGDTPMIDYHVILAKFIEFIKHFCMVFQNFLLIYILLYLFLIFDFVRIYPIHPNGIAAFLIF